MWESAISSHLNDVVPISSHSSDEMSNSTSSGLAGYYGVSGIPQINVGDQNDIWGTSTINNAIASTNAAAVTANACCVMTYSGDAITIKTQTKFFSASSGDYYLATYLMENGLLYSQSNATPDPYTHNHVLRGVAAGTKFGELISSGDVSAGTVFNKDYSVTAGTGWNLANVYVALVIWKKSGSTYSVINAWQSKAN